MLPRRAPGRDDLGSLASLSLAAGGMRGAAQLLRRTAVGARTRGYATKEGTALARSFACVRAVCLTRRPRSGRPSWRRRGREARLCDGARCAAHSALARARLPCLAHARAPRFLSALRRPRGCQRRRHRRLRPRRAGRHGRGEGRCVAPGCATAKLAPCVPPLRRAERDTQVILWTRSATAQPLRRRHRRACASCGFCSPLTKLRRCADGCGASRRVERAARAAAQQGQRRAQGCHQEAAAQRLTYARLSQQSARRPVNRACVDGSRETHRKALGWSLVPAHSTGARVPNATDELAAVLAVPGCSQSRSAAVLGRSRMRALAGCRGFRKRGRAAASGMRAGCRVPQELLKRVDVYQ